MLLLCSSLVHSVTKLSLSLTEIILNEIKSNLQVTVLSAETEQNNECFLNFYWLYCL